MIFFSFPQIFQSTPPARGATSQFPPSIEFILISIHAPRKGSDVTKANTQTLSHISIHAPRKGSDIIGSEASPILCAFQSTPPARGATKIADRLAQVIGISIHAPRKGSDLTRHSMSTQQGHFNPRPPQGERRFLLTFSLRMQKFQSTPPARGAT